MQNQQTYTISARNQQGAFCAGGTAKSLTAAIKQARAQFGAGWKIEIWQNEDMIKSWTIRK